MRFTVFVRGPQLEKAVGHLAVAGIQTITADFKAVEAVVTADGAKQAGERVAATLPDGYTLGTLKMED